MNSSFRLEVASPFRQVFAGDVTEVVLPSHDGEVGVRSNHEDFLGLLGTGPLRFVTSGNDHWLVVAQGIYRVESGKLTICAESVEEPKNIALDQSRAELASCQQTLASMSSHDPKYAELRQHVEKLQARIDVFTRTNLVN